MNRFRTRIKLCGMTRKEDVDYAIDLGVNALGFIFYSKSKRAVSIAKAKKLMASIPPFVQIVAVVVDPELSLVYDILHELPVGCLQFHGDESPAFCEQFGKPYIKAIHPISTKEIHSATERFSKAIGILLDTPSSEEKGGTGKTFNWDIVPVNVSKPIILAGGLNENVVKSAIDYCHPYGLDVCSGVEVFPGVKDPQKMKRLVHAIWGCHE